MARLETIFPTYFNTSPYENIVLVLLVSTLITSLIIAYKKNKKLPPGPVGLPFLGCLPMLGTEAHRTLYELSKKYGNLISLKIGSKLSVVANDYKLVKELMSHPEAQDRDDYVFNHIPHIGFVESNGTEWEEQRRFCMQASRDLGLGRKTWETLIQEDVFEFINDLKSLNGQATDISERLNYAVTNNILSLLIGRRLREGIDDSKIKVMTNYSDAAINFTGTSSAASLIPFLRKIFVFLKIAGYDRANETVLRASNLIREEIERHKKESKYEGVEDFINLYLARTEQKRAQKGKHFFSDDNLEGNIAILFLGANDTTFCSLGWLITLMAKYPEVQKKVQNELDEIIGRDNKICYEDRFRLPYTFAVLMESQRFTTTVPLPAPRRARSDFEFQGKIIPKGTNLILNTWALHNDLNYWIEPEKFHPERFLSKDKKKALTNLPSFLPFSIGKRNCPGETVAWMEILIFFASLMQNFHIKPPEGSQVSLESVYALVHHVKPQKLCFVLREDNA